MRPSLLLSLTLTFALPVFPEPTSDLDLDKRQFFFTKGREQTQEQSRPQYSDEELLWGRPAQQSNDDRGSIPGNRFIFTKGRDQAEQQSQPRPSDDELLWGKSAQQSNDDRGSTPGNSFIFTKGREQPQQQSQSQPSDDELLWGKSAQESQQSRPSDEELLWGKSAQDSQQSRPSDEELLWGKPAQQSQQPSADVQQANDDEWSGNRFQFSQLQQQPEQEKPEQQQPEQQPEASTQQPNSPSNEDENTHILKLTKKNGVYTTHLSIGKDTPLEFTVDTGSSDIWVNTKPGNGDFYDYTQSPYFKRLDTQKPFRTNDGSKQVLGFWGSDAISLFGSKFRSNIGFAESSAAANTMGLGPKQGEMLADTTSDGFASNTYPNLPILLQERRVIGQAAYSLWLNNDAESEGNLLFGAVDRAKYSGDLQKVPMVDGSTATGNQAHVNSVMLNSISTPNYNGEINKPVTLDTSTEYTELPMEVYRGLTQALDANIDYGSNTVYVDCNSETEVTFDFSGIRIPVRAKDLLLSPDDQGRCSMPVRPRTSLILGNVFLKNFYTVYDMDYREIAIAPAVHGDNANQHQLESITSGIPNATKAPNYSSTDFGAPPARNPWQGMW